MENGNIFPVKNRLKDLRKERHMTQTELVEALQRCGCDKVSMRTLRSYEGSKNKDCTAIPSNVLIVLSSLFDCSVDYLLGVSDCRSVDNDMIFRTTGLSDAAISKLSTLREFGHLLPVATINELLRSVTPLHPGLRGAAVEGADDLLSLIGLYVSGGELKTGDITAVSNLGYRIVLNGDALASGGLLSLISARLTECRMNIAKRRKSKERKKMKEKA